MPGRARLTRDQRGVIEDGLAGDRVVSWVELGRRVGVAASTVAREVGRNRGRVKYCADAAQVRAVQQVGRPKVAKLVALGPLRDRVNAELKLCRSPGAIALDLAAEGGERVCVESIYRAVYAGEMEPKARDCLRRRRAKRRGPPILTVITGVQLSLELAHQPGAIGRTDPREARLARKIDNPGNNE
jgi:IS30 family transposase